MNLIKLALVLPIFLIISCAAKRQPVVWEETGPLRVQVTLIPGVSMNGVVRATIRLQGKLPESHGYILAWEPGCTSTHQAWEPPQRVMSFNHVYHRFGMHRVYFGLVDLETQKLVGSGFADVQIGVPD